MKYSFGEFFGSLNILTTLFCLSFPFSPSNLSSSLHRVQSFMNHNASAVKRGSLLGGHTYFFPTKFIFGWVDWGPAAGVQVSHLQQAGPLW